MAKVVVLGAGLGGTIMAYELKDVLGKDHEVAVINKGSTYSFVPSNPWVAVGWRDRQSIEVDLEPVLARHGIAPGTAWADVPMNWTCPECDARKDDFEMVEI